MDQIILAGLTGSFFSAKINPRPTPVLFIHGAFSDHSRFYKLAIQFAENGFDAYAISRRGRFGQLPVNATGLTFADYLKDTLETINDIQPTPILIGHSLGGLLAMKAAEEISNIPALVLINTAPPAMLTAQLIALPYFLPLLPKIFLGKPFIPSKRAFKKLALQMMSKQDQEIIATTFVCESGIVYRQMMLGQIGLINTKKNIPTFIIGAANDRIISKAHNKTTVLKTNGTFKEYYNHGHWIIEEEGVELLALDIINWLNTFLR